MKTIALLPDYLVAQIAAGEVIERPAFAVKELIENAIDAKATQIEIELVDSGLNTISVSDNGSGMEKDDVLDSYKLHTTSKIDVTNSLLSIRSLGFRGEALASIAGISFLTIESRTKESIAGTRITVINGNLDSISSIGMPYGTRVIAEQLFHTVPARKKFLKSKRTELRRITDIVMEQAIANPNIGFTLRHENKILMELPSAQPIEQRIHSLFHSEISEHMFPVSQTESYLSIKGFIINPQQSWYIIPKQYLIINNRPVYDKLTQLAIKESFGVLINKNTQPSWFLYISIPNELIDVNIHPRKEQVNFADQQFLFESVKKTIEKTLKNQSITFKGLTNYTEDSTKLTKTSLGDALKEAIVPWNNKLLTGSLQTSIIQIHNLYLVVTTKEGMTIIDQHAAHERILYEQFIQEFFAEKEKKESVAVKSPILLTLSPSEQITFEEYREDFTNIGFQIEHYSGNTYNITNIPFIFKNRNIVKIFNQFLIEMKNQSFSPSIDTQSKRLLAYLSCRSAVKARDALTTKQMRNIISELKKIPSAITCPHGRPIQIAVSLGELDKLFRRK